MFTITKDKCECCDDTFYLLEFPLDTLMDTEDYDYPEHVGILNLSPGQVRLLRRSLKEVKTRKGFGDA